MGPGPERESPDGHASREPTGSEVNQPEVRPGDASADLSPCGRERTLGTFVPLNGPLGRRAARKTPARAGVSTWHMTT